MPRPPSSAVQIAIRIPAEWLAEAEEIAKQFALSRPGFSTTRSDILRAAIAKGLEVLRAEASEPPPAPPAPPSSRPQRRPKKR